MLLGIDAGTTRVKVALVDDERGVFANASIDCMPSRTDDGFVEIDMDRYWQACKECIGTVSKESKIDLKNINALAISSQGVTFVPVDRRGRELGNGIIYYDSRAKREAEELISRFGEKRLYQIAGQPGISAFFEAPKLIWIRKNEPKRFRNIHKILLVHDYLVFKLTGKFICVPSLISSSLLFDLKKKKWWEEMLDYIELSPEKLPQIYKHAEPIGTLTKKASLETGISSKTLVVTGAIDQICGMIGVGNIYPGLISESTGSVLAIHTVSNTLFEREDAGVYNFCNAIDNTYALISVCPTAGSALNWFMETFGKAEKEYADKTGRNVFELLTGEAEKIIAGSDGLIMLPHLAGRGSPRPNPLAKGIFYGFGLHHKKGHFVRALMESIAYMLRSNIAVFNNSDLEMKEIRSFGGGSQSRIWNQIKADVCGLSVITSNSREPGCLGAAILAGVGSGVFKNIEEGCRQLVLPGKRKYPDEAKSRQYERHYREYMKLNEIIEPMFEWSREMG